MNGEILQLINLTAFGNHYLNGGIIPVDFSLNNEAFQNCTVAFQIVQNQCTNSIPHECLVAENPEAWFQWLKLNGCKHLRLCYKSSYQQDQPHGGLKDHIATAFVGGGGTWYIKTVYEHESHYWINQWELIPESMREINGFGKKVWSVHYKLIWKGENTSHPPMDMIVVTNQLKNTLDALIDFTEKHKIWNEIFIKAKNILDYELTENAGLYQDIFPSNNYSLTALQLLFSAREAWVFGGMGSWNDLGFSNKEDNETYEKLSEELYLNLIHAIIVAINSF